MANITPSFVVELPLCICPALEEWVEKAFELGRNIYNATLGGALGRIRAMRESRAWREACAMPKGAERNKQMAAVRASFRLTKYDLFADANNHRNRSGRGHLLGAHESQQIALTVWKAVDNYLFRKGGLPRFKSASRGLHSIEGTNNQELKWDPLAFCLVWRKKCFPAINSKPEYLGLVFEPRYVPDFVGPVTQKYPVPKYVPRVKYCRIVWKKIKGVKRWFVQLVVEGTPPVRHCTAPLERKVGADLGPSKIGIFAEDGATALQPVAPGAEMDHRDIRRIQRALDRSRRAMNPDNYNPDGTIKPGPKTWVISKRYKERLGELQEAFRRATETRKSDHGYLINLMLAHGGTIRLETISYKAYQKLYGKSAQRQGMGEFVLRLKAAAARAGSKVEELNTRVLKMSQYDYATGTYTKKPLKERWHRVGNTDVWVQRDIMSAALACFVTQDGHDPALIAKVMQAADLLLRAAGFVQNSKPSKCDDPTQVRPLHEREPLVFLTSERVGSETLLECGSTRTVKTVASGDRTPSDVTLRRSGIRKARVGVPGGLSEAVDRRSERHNAADNRERKMPRKSSLSRGRDRSESSSFHGEE